MAMAAGLRFLCHLFLLTVDLENLFVAFAWPWDLLLFLCSVVICGHTRQAIELGLAGLAWLGWLARLGC